MLQLSPQSRIFVATQAVDFRKGIDALCQLCRERLAQDPFSGAFFVFRNRDRTAIRVLAYDGQGYCLFHKRLSNSRLQWWPTELAPMTTLVARELHILLWNGNPKKAQLGEDWRAVA